MTAARVAQPGGILGKAGMLRQEFGVEIMRDAEAVAHIEERIGNRDEIARMISRHTGMPLPDWVGKD